MAGGKAYAYRAVDGTLVWQHDVGAVSVRPAIDGGRLYLAADDGRIIALDIKDGNQVWEQRIPEQPAEPLGSGDRVYVGGGDRHFYCLEAKNGEIAWNWRVGAAINLPPSADAERVYFVGLDNVLRALDRSSGVQKWQRAVRRRVAAGPVLLRDVVLVASESSGEIWGWTAAGAPAGVIATPAEPAVQPEFEDAGQQGARIFVVTGSLESVWRLTLITSAGDPPLVPLTELPGTMVPPAGR
jgi:outer membrane protein assembly factor BamB